jgi:hypothetical protein
MIIILKLALIKSSYNTTLKIYKHHIYYTKNCKNIYAIL